MLNADEAPDWETPMKQFSRVCAVALLSLELALPALAAKPTIVDNPFTPFVIPAASGCGTLFQPTSLARHRKTCVHCWNRWRANGAC